MSRARNLIRDLVDKKLWPVALLLAAAIVVIPVVVGGGAGPDATADLMVVPPASGATAAPKAVELVGPPPATSRPGKERDPFRQPKKPAAAAATAGAAAAATTTATTATTAGATTATPTGEGTKGIDTTKAIDVRFGTPGSLRRIRSLKPGSDLRAAGTVAVRYAGVVASTGRARFVAVNKTLGQTSGDARCYRRNDRCYALDMKAGDKQTFVLDGVRQEIEIVSIAAGGGKAGGQDAAASRSYHRTAVSFGGADGQQAKARPISRLTPFPAVTGPAAIYVGVSADGKRATFLLAPGAAATGDGTCVDATCRVIALKAGESTVIEVTPAAGTRLRYTLRVASVNKVAASEDAARTARARVHPEGRDVLRAMLHDGATAAAMASIGFDPATGTLESRSTNLEKVTG